MPSPFAKPKTTDPVLPAVEQALRPGEFIRHDAMPDFVDNLRQTEEKLAALVQEGEAERAILLYEVFLSGCYDKLEQCDDSGGTFGLFFDSLVCGWIQARQAAGRPADDTVRRILGGKEPDAPGGCHDLERGVAAVLDGDGLRLLAGQFEAELDDALAELTRDRPSAIFEYGNQVRLPALALKDLYESTKDAKGYAAVCERLGISPRDCERLAEIEAALSHWAQALAWVERGQALAPARSWHNEASHSLDELKSKLLGKLGPSAGFEPVAAKPSAPPP